MKNLYILGSCGSIGTQTLDIVRNNKKLYFVKGISVGSDIIFAKEVIEEFKPEIICFRHEKDLKIELSYNPIKVFGDKGLIKVAKYNKGDNGILINALVGSVGLIPTIEAIKVNRDIALANKETLVMAGDIISKLIKEYNVKLFPIDSEHSAIWQCLRGENTNEVKRLIITASGGAFRDKERSELTSVTVEDALNHPNWKMGSKITIDSATMMNKGFEVIEAHHLFGLSYDKISTILHRQSVIHSMVEFKDGSIKAVLGTPDMRMPIHYALSYPHHKKNNIEFLDLAKISQLNFSELSLERYPCLKYAYEVGEKGGLYPTVLNAANEAAVKLFLLKKISFLEIERIINEEIHKIYSEELTIENIIYINKDIQSKILKKYGVE